MNECCYELCLWIITLPFQSMSFICCRQTYLRMLYLIKLCTVDYVFLTHLTNTLIPASTVNHGIPAEEHGLHGFQEIAMETIGLQSSRIYLVVSGFPSIQGWIQEIAMETSSLQSSRIYLFVSGFPSFQGRIQKIAMETPSLQSSRIYLFVSGFPAIQGRIQEIAMETPSL